MADDRHFMTAVDVIPFVSFVVGRGAVGGDPHVGAVFLSFEVVGFVDLPVGEILITSIDPFKDSVVFLHSQPNLKSPFALFRGGLSQS